MLTGLLQAIPPAYRAAAVAGLGSFVEMLLFFSARGLRRFVIRQLKMHT
jgi:hypothetical protein